MLKGKICWYSIWFMGCVLQLTWFFEFTELDGIYSYLFLAGLSVPAAMIFIFSPRGKEEIKEAQKWIDTTFIARTFQKLDRIIQK